MTRRRMDVWARTDAEGVWPAVLTDYERAVGVLRSRDPQSGKPSNPLGWRFLAAIHGLAAPNGAPDTSNPLWSMCQHGSWYFLPWHRMYLRAFELIIQDALNDDQWALPYWYTVDPDDPATSVLPPAFRDTTPGNNLFTTNRSLRANGGLPLPPLGPAVVDALNIDVFSTPDGIAPSGGGERSTPNFDGGELGLLEGTPHGAVHSLVGNDYNQQWEPVRFGWMGSFFTAALDPVFWLHHANIDRLWQVWLDQDPSHANPTGDNAWFDTKFSFPAGGGVIEWTVGEVLDTTALDYEYENTDAPSGVTPPVVPVGGGGPDIGLGGGEMSESIPPQLLGATADVPIALSDTVELELTEPVDVTLADGTVQPVGSRVFLRIEGVTGTAAAPVYEVYVNVPAGDAPTEHPELRAGSLSTFGMVEASRSDDVHDASGLTAVFEITSVRDALAEEGRWDPSRVLLTFSPVESLPPDDDIALALDEMEPSPADIRASRIAVIAI